MRLSIAVLASTMFALPAAAQTAAPPHTTPGAVTRVTLVEIKPGKADEFWTDIRTNQKLIFDEFQRRGMITNYQYFTNVTRTARDDWNVGVSVSYANWAALDGFGSRADSITLRHYGSAERRTAAGRARSEYSDVMQSFLIRGQTPNPVSR